MGRAEGKGDLGFIDASRDRRGREGCQRRVFARIGVDISRFLREAAKPIHRRKLVPLAPRKGGAAFSHVNRIMSS